VLKVKNNFRIGEKIFSTYPSNMWNGIRTITEINNYGVTILSGGCEGLIEFEHIKKLSWKEIYERKKGKKVSSRESGFSFI